MLLALVLVSCAAPAPAPATVTSTTPTPSEAAPPPTASPAAPATPIAPTASAADPASARTPEPPAPVSRSGKVWPFHAWNEAVAVTYNHMQIQPRVPLLAYDDRGWSPHVVGQKPLSKEKADVAVTLLVATEGGVEVSKCPFPRHAVVLLDRGVPVASINVCFECGDILIWPSWGPEPDWDKLTDKERKAMELRTARQMKLYEETFPKWQAFFRDEVGFPLEGSW